jgi:hypothetical protein
MKLEDQDAYPVHKTLTESQPAPIVDIKTTKITYMGYAALGTLTSRPEWKILRITTASAVAPSGVVITEYADGNMNYDNVWDDRYILSYSR